MSTTIYLGTMEDDLDEPGPPAARQLHALVRRVRAEADTLAFVMRYAPDGDLRPMWRACEEPWSLLRALALAGAEDDAAVAAAVVAERVWRSAETCPETRTLCSLATKLSLSLSFPAAAHPEARAALADIIDKLFSLLTSRERSLLHFVGRACSFRVREWPSESWFPLGAVDSMERLLPGILLAPPAAGTNFRPWLADEVRCALEERAPPLAAVVSNGARQRAGR